MDASIASTHEEAVGPIHAAWRRVTCWVDAMHIAKFQRAWRSAPRRIVLLASVMALHAGVNAQSAAAPSPDLTAPYVLMDFTRPIDLAALPSDWRHRTFFRTRPMQISFVNKASRAAIRLETHGSASMLYRNVNISVERLPLLGWGWLVEQPVVSELDELTSKGDDHPARLYLKFQSLEGDEHAMEIIWGNVKLGAGDWKYLKSFWRSQPFPHYVARGGQANVGRWHDERVDLRELYRKQWGAPAGVRLIELAIFCDTDQTETSSLAYFSTIRMEPTGP
jgi:hypothetical protein